MKSSASLSAISIGAGLLLAPLPSKSVESVEFVYEKVEWVRAAAGAADAARALAAAKKCERAGKTADVEKCLVRVGFRKRIDQSSPMLAKPLY